MYRRIEEIPARSPPFSDFNSESKVAFAEFVRADQELRIKIHVRQLTVSTEFVN